MGQDHYSIYSTPTATSGGTGTEPAAAVDQLPGAWRFVEKAAAARDVPPGQSWAFTDHRSMAEIIADEETQ